MDVKPWRLLFRVEDGQKVWLYAQMFGKELTRMTKQGWELVQQ